VLPDEPAEVRGARPGVVLLRTGVVVRLTCGLGDVFVRERYEVSRVNEQREDGRKEEQGVMKTLAGLRLLIWDGD
jgi:hypothetical protein